MTDVLLPKRRIYLMSRVRGHCNEFTEIELLTLFRQSKISCCRRHLPLPGGLDLALPKGHLANPRFRRMRSPSSSTVVFGTDARSVTIARKPTGSFETANARPKWPATVTSHASSGPKAGKSSASGSMPSRNPPPPASTASAGHSLVVRKGGQPCINLHCIDARFPRSY